MFPQMVDYNNNNNGDGAIFLVVMVGCGMLVAVVVVHILHLVNLSRCLQQVRPRNRDMEPGYVWFSLIPIFNVVWVFIVVNRVANSLSVSIAIAGEALAANISGNRSVSPITIR